MRTLLNLFRAFSILAIGGLIGYYDFQTSGYMGVITNAVYFILGILLVTTWKSPERKNCEEDFDSPYLSVQDTDVNAAEPTDMTDRPESLSESMSQE